MNVVIYLSENIDRCALSKLKMRATVVDTFDNAEKIDAIIVRRVKVTREIIKKATRLKVIGMHGIGCDSIDLAAAKEFGIKVINVPTGNVESVAELAVGFIFELCRKISKANVNLRQGKYHSFAPVELTGSEIYGKAVGLIGVGHISQRISEILQNAFNCSVLGYDPYCSDENYRRLHIQKIDSLESLISESDIVNVSVPLNKTTKNMIDRKKLNCFKPNALLICTSHGGIIDEDALYEALRQEKLAGAACDVFLQDPPSKDNPLLSLDNLIATPHIGGNTHECLSRVGNEIADHVFDCLDGKQVHNQVV